MNRTRLKYYLRALGVGIVVTALLMGYSQKGQARMTDEEILRRAAELGMTDHEGVLAELATATPKPDGPVSAAEPTAQPAATPEAGPTEEPEEQSLSGSAADSMAEPAVDPTEEPTISTADPTESPTADPTAGPTAKPTADPTAGPTATSTARPTEATYPEQTGETVTLVVNRGESSVTVSKSLQELGLVEDYKAYDRFLCDNGYDHSISTGTYEIPLDASDEDIAWIITKKR